MGVLVFGNFVRALAWLHSQKADDVAHCLCRGGGIKRNKKLLEVFLCSKLLWTESFNVPAYRREFAQMKGRRSLPSQTRLPLLPTLLQSLAVKPSGCGRPPSPPDPPARETPAKQCCNQRCTRQAGNCTPLGLCCVSDVPRTRRRNRRHRALRCLGRSLLPSTSSYS